MSTQNLKFIHLSTGSASAHKADTGAIIFEKATGRIAVATGANTDVEYYGGGRIADATFDTEGKVLTLSFNDGSDAIKLDFSDTASATGVNAIMKAHADRISALEATVGDSKSGLVKDVADNKTAIDAINNTSTGILAEAKKYTNGKIGDIGDKTVSVYVDDAKAAAIEAAKTYADTTFDTKGSAAAAQTAATEAAKNYTDGKVSEINTTTDGLRKDLGVKTAEAGTDTAFGRIKALEGTVGNASSGLVKDVADNADAITALQDLHANKTGESGKMKVIDEINAKVGDIKINDKAVTVKEYVDAGDAKALADAKKYTDTEIGNVNTAAKDLGTRVTTLETTVGDKDSGLVNKVNTLIGEDADKSVRVISAEEVAKVVADAPENFDTLREIADWIANDKTGAASMQTDIANLKTKVGADGDEASATGSVYARIKKNAADIAGNLTKINANTNSISDHTTRIVALEEKHAEGKTVAEEVAKGIDDLGVTSKSNVAGSDVVVTVTTTKGKVSEVAVDASGLRNDLGDKGEGKGTAFARIEALETTVGDSESGLVKAVATNTTNISKNAAAIKDLQDAQASGSLMWSVWD